MSDETSERSGQSAAAPEGADAAPADDATGKKGAVRRNPYIVAFVAGVVTLTYLHVRLQYEPDLPPVIGSLTDVELVTRDAADAPFARPTLVAVLPEAGDDCGAAALASKARVWFASEGVDAHVALVSTAACDAKCAAGLEATLGGARPGAWVGGPASVAAATRLEDALTGAWARRDEASAASFRRPPIGWEPVSCDTPGPLARVVLVDADGAVRGFFDPTAWEVDSEVFHRTRQIVAAEAR